MAGVETAVEFLTDPVLFSKFLDPIYSKSSPALPSFEILFQTVSLSGQNAGQPGMLAFRIGTDARSR